MRISIISNALLAVFLLTGCSSTFYYADFIKPSEVYIPSKIYAVGLLNRGASPDLAAAIYTQGIPYQYIKQLPLRVSQKTMDRLKTNVEKLNRFKTVPIEWDAPLRDVRDFMEQPLTADQIDSLCDAYQVDGIIALEGVDLTIRTDGEVNVVSVSDDAGMPVRVPEFTSNRQVDYTVAWRFYDGLKLESIDFYQESYERYFYQVAYDPNEASELDPDQMELFDIAIEAARDYQKRISPHWDPGYRLYYRGNTEELREISKQLEYNRDWGAAASEWVKLTKAENEKVKYFASYNMAVASEMLGRPRVAKEWLDKAGAIKSTNQVERYRATIREQILIYDVVDRQLGLD